MSWTVCNVFDKVCIMGEFEDVFSSIILMDDQLSSVNNIDIMVIVVSTKLLPIPSIVLFFLISYKD